jgi:hypothetical protein
VHNNLDTVGRLKELRTAPGVAQVCCDKTSSGKATFFCPVNVTNHTPQPLWSHAVCQYSSNEYATEKPGGTGYQYWAGQQFLR